jgi:hypothetical protein
MNNKKIFTYGFVLIKIWYAFYVLRQEKISGRQALRHRQATSAAHTGGAAVGRALRSVV